MSRLCGKGIWLAYSHDLQRATEIATAIEAQYLLVKVGHGPFYFPETARTMVQRVQSLGFHALAWVELTDYAPKDALKAIVESLSLGYEATVIMMKHAALTGEMVRPLAEGLDNVEIPRSRLFLATPPLAYLPDRSVLEELAPLCQGGWMPLCFASWGMTPEQVVEREIYHALSDLGPAWGQTPEVYPVLSPLGAPAKPLLLPEEFIPWVERIIHHGVNFFSVYHAALTEKALWQLLQPVNVPCRETEEIPTSPTPTEVVTSKSEVLTQPIYITVTVSDTVWGIISRYGLTKQQFWAWNGHLWDSKGLPRDADYMQKGWRIRVR